MPDLDPTHYRLNDLKQRWGQDPSSRLFLQLADEHRKLGQHQEAVAVLEQGLEHRPNDLSALVALGRSRLELENLEEAIEPLKTVVSRDPTHIVASKLLIEAHLQRGDAVKASERLQTYRLLNDRDPELDHLEYRLERLQAETEDEASTVVGSELPGELEPDVGATEPLEDVIIEADAKAAEADVANVDTPEKHVAEALPAPASVAREEIARPVSEPDVRPDTEAPSAELFQLAEDSPPPDLEALWATLPEKPAVAAEPFQGLTTLAAARHWDLLSQEGIFASPEAPADGDETPAVVEGVAPVEETASVAETASVEVSAAVEETGAVDEPAMALAEEVAAPEVDVYEESSEPEPVSLLSDEAPPLGEAPQEEEALLDEAPALDEVHTDPVSAEPEAVITTEPDPVPDAVASDPVDESIAAEAQPEVDVAIEASEPEEPVGMAAAAIAGALGAAAVAGSLATSAAATDTEVADTAATEVLAAPDVEPGTESATVTLGELYLKQGHQEEAEKIFQKVLEQDPDNRLALESLARLKPRRSEPLTAADLLAVRSANARVPEGLTAKKVLILGNYIKHLRAAAPRLDSDGARSVDYVP